jgi:hypothetical protein
MSEPLIHVISDEITKGVVLTKLNMTTIVTCPRCHELYQEAARVAGAWENHRMFDLDPSTSHHQIPGPNDSVPAL